MASGKRSRTAVGSAASLTWVQVMAWRVRRHRLDRRAPCEAMLDVVAAICGLHAQLASSAELSLWARVDGLEAGDVDRALWEDRTLVKMWAMRGTLHLLPSSEYRLWQAALGSYAHYLKDAWLNYFGVDEEQLGRLLDAVATALKGRTLTRSDLASEVSRLTGSDELGGKLRESWGALLKPASFRGRLIFAPSAGQNVRFTHPTGWLEPGPHEEEPGRALREVVRRYLSAYGPATREDLARWWGTTPAQAAGLLKELGEEVREVEVEGLRAWMPAAAVDEATSEPPLGSVRLLPAFDHYVAANTKQAPHLMPGDFASRIYRPQGWMSPVMLVDGRMDGTWRHERKGSRLEVVLEPFVELPAWARSAAEEEAERLARFLGGTLELAWV